jgi:SNF2 family DNA or RNA helicase
VAPMDQENMAGCLLAHTMGLGKTVQSITLLVAIAEAAQSPDPKVNTQIPLGLRESKTLVLCPPSLIDNWMDELLLWTPPGNILGNFRKLDSSVKSWDRLGVIADWYEDGGILLMGYEMFRKLVLNKKTKIREPALAPNEHNQVLEHLLQGPNIIIADEAHKMKNASAGVTLAAAQFRSKSRLALTGSPLANNILEYHTMIEWVAPNYLGRTHS